MVKALTAKHLENLKPTATRQEIPDGLVSGLYLVLQPSGRAAWAVRYRHEGRTRKLTLGAYPAIALVDAREAARAALVDVAKGKDPGVRETRPEAAVRRAALVEHVAAMFVERHAKMHAARSWRETDRILKKEVIDRWRGRTLAEISRADVHDLLDAVVDRGSPIMANRVLAALRRMCSWAAERDLIAVSPCAGVRAPSVERSRDRVLSDGELRSIWTACEALGQPFGPLIQLLILTGQRRDEVGGMRWCEVRADERAWVLPKERTKNGCEHLVPLSPSSLSLLKRLPRIVGPDGQENLVFTTNGITQISGFSKAKLRIDAMIMEQTGENLPPWTLHDLRRTFASGCACLGADIPVIEKILNHVSGTFRGIVGVYQRHSYTSEKRAALEAWETHVMKIVRD